MRSTGSKNGEWLTHPAFWWDNNNNGIIEEDEELNGFWVGKFETTGTPQNPSVKPGIKTLVGVYGVDQDLKHQFLTAKQFNLLDYGLTDNFDAHVMKNIEWGAVAFLSQSQYGKYGNDMYQGAYKEVYQNKSSELITGSSNGTPGQSGARPGGQCAYNDMTDLGEGKGLCGPGASTTGNIYGVYDMSGGAYEYVMGGMLDTTGQKLFRSSSGFELEELTLNHQNFIGRKYLDIYEYGTTYNDDEAYQRAYLGDATGETPWDGPYMVCAECSPDGGPKRTLPWFSRGCSCNCTTNAGIFYFSHGNACSWEYHTFRLVIT